MNMEPGITADLIQALESEWSKSQDALTHLSSSSSPSSSMHHIVRDTGHDIAHENPNAIVAAVVELLKENNM